MKRTLLISILCLFAFTAFSQIIDVRVTYPDNNKCASATVSARVRFEEMHVPTISREWYVQGQPGVYSTNTMCEVIYNTPGTYWVVLQVTWGTVTKNDTIWVTIHPMPVFSISKGNDSICPGGSIPFSFTMNPPSDSGKIVSVLWEFGDGSAANTIRPNHTYLNPANTDRTYGIRLTVIDTVGCSARIDSIDFVHVRSKPEVFFNTNGTFFCLDKTPEEATVIFTNKTDTARPWAANTYLWNFGDGNTSTQTNPTHIYQYDNTPGARNSYTPRLIAVDQFNCTDTFVLSTSIRLNKIVMNYSHTPLPICQLPDTIRLSGHDLMSNYHWEIRNGSGSLVSDLWGRTPFLVAQDTGTYTLIVTQSHLQNANCQVRDTLVFNVYDNTRPIIIATDTNECDPDHPITFINTTAHLGMGVTNWHFGNTRTDGGYTTIQGDSVVYTYSTASHSLLPNGDKGNGYGDYRVMMTTPAPYGCPTDTVFQDIHIFKTYSMTTVINPAPSYTLHGCAPHTITFVDISDSLVSSSPIMSYIWRWDSAGTWNQSDTLLETTGSATHTYTDTGKYTVALSLINAHGCSQDIKVADIMVGHPPITNFTFTSDTNCLPSLNIQVMAYDSLNGGSLVANARANDWQWLDDNNVSIGAATQTSSIFPHESGEVAVKLISYHNGCPSVNPVRKVGLGYAYPQSIPDFVSSKDAINFDNKKDTLCISANEFFISR